MEEKKPLIISDRTAVSLGLLVIMAGAFVSWGIMYNKVTSFEKLLERENYGQRITILETTIPQIKTSLDGLEKKQDEILKVLQPTKAYGP